MKKYTVELPVGRHRLKVQKLEFSEPDHPSRPVLVFLHEGLGCIEHWKDFPSRLCANVKIDGLVYDRKGYGGSSPYKGPWPKNYLVEEACIDLPELLHSLGIQKVILIGHSDGGSIALLAAATLKDSVVGAVCEAAHIFVEKKTLGGIQRFMSVYHSTVELKKKLSRYHRDQTDKVVQRWAETWLAPSFIDWNIESFLPQITCPLLVLQGENDEYATVEQAERIVAQASGPAKKIIIAECGHTPHLQAGDYTLKVISDFILSIVQPSALDPR